MTYLIEHLTTELDETNRLAVYQDEFLYNYQDIIGDELGVFTLKVARGLKEIEGGKLTGELNSLARNVHEWQLESACRKYLTLTGLEFMEVNLQGYSPSEWATVLVYGDGPWINEAAKSLKAWFRGDVYTIAHEQLVTYTATNGNTIERWEVIDSLGGVLADSGDEIKALAFENFALEKAAA